MSARLRDRENLPPAPAGTKAGHEIEHPLAVVILGGLVTSTVLNLFLMPAIYMAFGRVTRRADDEEAGLPTGRTIDPAVGSIR